jgi:hypothetical protein
MAKLTIDVKTPVRAIRAWRRAHPRSKLALDPALTGADLTRIVERHATEPYSTDIHELAIAHPHANAAVFRAVLRVNGNDSQIQNTIVTSGRAPRSIVSKLATSPHHSVREHARIALLTQDLDEQVHLDFSRILEHAGGDNGVGVRWTLARHEQTPSRVLSILSKDESDVVAKAAKERLKNSRRR